MRVRVTRGYPDRRMRLLQRFGCAGGFRELPELTLVSIVPLPQTLDRGNHFTHFLPCIPGINTLANTLVFTDGVSRGQCDVREGLLHRVREVFDVRRGEFSSPGHLLDGEDVELKLNAPVSMNLWGFVPPFLDSLRDRWSAFREGSSPEAEFLLPSAVTNLIDAGVAEVEAIPTSERPFGLTRPEDLPRVQMEIARLVADGGYPADLRIGLA